MLRCFILHDAALLDVACCLLRCCMLHDAYLDSGHAEQEMLHVDHDVRQRVGYL